MSTPLNERHCRAEMCPGSGVFCGRHRGHETEPGDSGHRQRGEDGGARWPNDPTPQDAYAALRAILDDLHRAARLLQAMGADHADLQTLAVAYQGIERVASKVQPKVRP